MDDPTPTRGLELADPDEVDWLRELEPGGSMSFFPRAWPAETWVLHGIWEDPVDGPVESICADRSEPGSLFCATAAGVTTPPDGWRRLRWRELAARLDTPLAGSNRGEPVPPCFCWFPFASWPGSLVQPSEGSLDAPTGDRLISVLARVTEGGEEAPSLVYYSGAGWPFGEWSSLTLRGPLRSVLDIARTSTRHAPSPDNVWPEDRSWLLTTDWDLWGTRVAGAPDVVAALEADPELETIQYPHALKSC